MDSSDAIQFLILIILICLSAFFSSAETSMTTVNKIRIQTLAQEGDRRAETLLKVVEDPGKLLSTILIGNNIVNLSASSLATTLTMRLFGSAAVGISPSGAPGSCLRKTGPGSDDGHDTGDLPDEPYLRSRPHAPWSGFQTQRQHYHRDGTAHPGKCGT